MTTGTSGISARLRAMALLLLPIALANAVTWPSVHTLVQYWWDITDYQHGILVALLSALWIGRELWQGEARDVRPSLIGTLLLAAALLAWIVAERGGINIMHQLLWPVVLGTCVWAKVGPTVARRLAPAIGLLYFAIPVWDYGLPVLQRLSIFFSEHILALLGVPATVSEYLVTIPEGTFAIIEGCSGKRYFVVALAVAYLAMAINHLRGLRAMLFLALSAFLAMLMNWIRIVIVIYAGHATGMQHYLVANEHQSLGNALFVVLIAVVLLCARWMARPAVIAAPEPALRPTSSGAGGRSGSRLAAAPVALLVLTAIVSHWRIDSHSPATLGPLPVATGRWQGPIPPQAGWRPAYAAADAEHRAAYASSAGLVEVYINMYTNQREGRELIHIGNKLVAPDAWVQPWSDPERSLAGGSWGQAGAMRGPDGQVWLLNRAYFVRTRMFRSELAAKLAYGWFSLAGSAPSGVLAAAVRCEGGNCDQARMLVADFWKNMQLSMQAMLPPGADRAP